MQKNYEAKKFNWGIKFDTFGCNVNLLMANGPMGEQFMQEATTKV